MVTVTGLVSYDHVELVGGSGGVSRGFKTFSFTGTHAKQHAHYKTSFLKGVVDQLLTCQATYFMVKA